MKTDEFKYTKKEIQSLLKKYKVDLNPRPKTIGDLRKAIEKIDPRHDNLPLTVSVDFEDGEGFCTGVDACNFYPKVKGDNILMGLDFATEWQLEHYTIWQIADFYKTNKDKFSFLMRTSSESVVEGVLFRLETAKKSVNKKQHIPSKPTPPADRNLREGAPVVPPNPRKW